MLDREWVKVRAHRLWLLKYTLELQAEIVRE
jgi:hypothetical protein